MPFSTSSEATLISASAGASPQPENCSTEQAWGRIADVGVFMLWLATAGVALRYHEKWADEAQSWLLARDLDLKTLWFRELRYEGSPGLWHTMLWVAQHVFHLPYAGLGMIGFLGAAAGVAFVLWKAPFPRPIRYLFVFSYYIVYQYAAIARPYTLLPLLAFGSAYLFDDREHPERIAIVLILLANLSAHGMLLSACLGTAYLIKELRAWPTLTGQARRKFVVSAIALIVVAGFLFVVLKPPPDVEALQGTHTRTLAGIFHRTLEGISGALFDNDLLSLAWLAIASVWAWQRRRFWIFFSPVLVLSLFYGAVYGLAHHQGTILVAAMMGVWIAWPAGRSETPLPRQRVVHHAFAASLVILFAWQIWDSAVVIRNEYRFPYSGAEDAAKYLKSVGADRQQIFGYLYGMAGIQAYFDHNIEANSATAYFHHGAPFVSTKFDTDEIQRLSPEYIVVPCWFNVKQTFEQLYQPAMASQGYSLVHFSDGYMLWKRGVAMRQVYFIFRRN
jgi:hypothetical protein